MTSPLPAWKKGSDPIFAGLVTSPLPAWLDVSPWLDLVRRADRGMVAQAVAAANPGIREFAILLSDAAAEELETLAARAQDLTRRHFGRTISLYAPLYLSNYCPAQCAYCGFASDRKIRRHKLTSAELAAEGAALKRLGLEEVLVLTGDRLATAGYEFVELGPEKVTGSACSYREVDVDAEHVHGQVGADGHAASGPRSPAGTTVRVGKVLGAPLGDGLQMGAQFLGVPDDLAYEVGPLFGQDVASRSCGQQLLGLLRREPRPGRPESRRSPPRTRPRRAAVPRPAPAGHVDVVAVAQ